MNTSLTQGVIPPISPPYHSKAFTAEASCQPQCPPTLPSPTQPHPDLCPSVYTCLVNDASAKPGTMALLQSCAVDHTRSGGSCDLEETQPPRVLCQQTLERVGPARAQSHLRGQHCCSSKVSLWAFPTQLHNSVGISHRGPVSQMFSAIRNRSPGPIRTRIWDFKSSSVLLSANQYPEVTGRYQVL